MTHGAIGGRPDDARSYSPSRPIPTGDECRLASVTDEDGEEVTVRVHGGAPMSPEAREALGELVRAVQRRYLRDHPEEATQ